MIEIILLFVIVALWGFIGFMDQGNRKERKSLLNALLSKTHEELINLELADKTKIEAKPKKEAEDLVPLESLSNDEYEKKVLNNG